MGTKVVRVQPGVQMIDLARWLDAEGYECSFAPGLLGTFPCAARTGQAPGHM